MVLQLAKRVQRLEAQVTEVAELRPRSPKWRAYWEEKLARIVSGEEPGEALAVPLEIWDAIEG